MKTRVKRMTRTEDHKGNEVFTGDDAEHAEEETEVQDFNPSIAVLTTEL